MSCELILLVAEVFSLVVISLLDAQSSMSSHFFSFVGLAKALVQYSFVSCEVDSFGVDIT